MQYASSRITDGLHILHMRQVFCPCAAPYNQRIGVPPGPSNAINAMRQIVSTHLWHCCVLHLLNAVLHAIISLLIVCVPATVSIHIDCTISKSQNALHAIFENINAMRCCTCRYMFCYAARLIVCGAFFMAYTWFYPCMCAALG